MMVWFSRNI